jgi:ribosomal protein S18 acetylase RimI-like enzyme
MKLIVRKATLRDLDSLHEMHKELIDFESKIDPLLKKKIMFSRSRERYRKSFSKKNHVFFIAEIDGNPVGYAYGLIEKSPYWIEPNLKGYLCDVLIRKGFRGKGIGEMLVNQMEKYFKKNKVHWLMLGVYSKNSNAKKVWKGLGFKEYMNEMTKKI